jgi:hypothetical protein
MANLTVYLLKVSNLRRSDRHLRYPGNLRSTVLSSGPPLSRLEYYETLMLFFERLGCSAGAMQCAHAALHEVEAGAYTRSRLS